MEIEIKYSVVEIKRYRVKRETRSSSIAGTSMSWSGETNREHGEFDNLKDAEAVAEALERMEAHRLKIGP